jgi:hypothetical protein
MTQTETVEYEAEVARLRRGMDEKEFEAAWAEGRRLTIDQAISYAISGSLPAA